MLFRDDAYSLMRPKLCALWLYCLQLAQVYRASALRLSLSWPPAHYLGCQHMSHLNHHGNACSDEIRSLRELSEVYTRDRCSCQGVGLSESHQVLICENQVLNSILSLSPSPCTKYRLAGSIWWLLCKCAQKSDLPLHAVPSELGQGPHDNLQRPTEKSEIQYPAGGQSSDRKES